MKNKTMSVLALGLVALLGVGLVAAYQGDYSVKGPNYSEDRHERMEEAFENLDYDAWVALMSESGRMSRVLDVVNEDNFAIFVAVHEAMKEGDMEKASELRAELGLGVGHMDANGFGRGKGMGQMSGSRNCPHIN
jgi:hypothetical protein